jgi:Flp pilus assembly protein TadG
MSGRGSLPAIRRAMLWIRDSRGGPAVEFALLLPFLTAMIYGVIETGRLMWTLNTLNYAVDSAARCRAVSSASCNSDSNAASYAAAQAMGLAPASAFTVASCTISGVSGEKVSINYSFQSPVMELLPRGTNYSVTLVAQSCYPL